MRFAIVIEQTENNFSAYAPDVPGCGVTGATAEEVKALLAEALVLHLELDPLDHAPRTQVEYVEIDLPVGVTH